MKTALNIQSYYNCQTCKNADDIHGRSCRKGLLFPLLLIVENKIECPYYHFDSDNANKILEENQ